MSSAHSPTFVTPPTSQLVLQPFFRFSYITGFSLTSPGEPPMVLNKLTIMLSRDDDLDTSHGPSRNSGNVTFTPKWRSHRLSHGVHVGTSIHFLLIVLHRSEIFTSATHRAMRRAMHRAMHRATHRATHRAHVHRILRAQKWKPDIPRLVHFRHRRYELFISVGFSLYRVFHGVLPPVTEHVPEVIWKHFS